MKYWLTILVAVPLTASAFDLSCSLGARCITTQGTRIPSSKVIEMSERCDDFIKNDIGQRALKMSIKEVQDRSKNNFTHPLWLAMDAFEYLHGSPLKFERKSNAEDTNYFEIKRSCLQLNRDFYDDNKWNK